jgi:hypothetical protein
VSQHEIRLVEPGCLIQHAGGDVCLTQNEIARYVEMIFEEGGAQVADRYACKLEIPKKTIAQR